MNQMKVLAVAIGALIALPAFADTTPPSVTLYGVADVGLRVGDYGDGVRTQVESGQGFGSRIGVKGEQWFDDGLFKGMFQAESGINYGTGTNTQGGLPWGRQIYAGLSNSDVGTLTFGRQYTPAFIVMDSVDAFDTGFGGNLANTLGNIGAFATSRADNMAKWVSPNWAGVTMTLGYTTSMRGGTGQESGASSNAAGNDRYGSGFLGSFEYSIGKLYVGAAYQNIKLDDVGADKTNNNTTKYFIGGVTYNLDFAKLFASYADGSVTTAQGVAGTPNARLSDGEGWGFGATIPVGARNTIVTQYSHYTDKLNGSNNCALLGLGDEYQAAKALMLYAMAARVSNSSTGTCTPAGAASNDLPSAKNFAARNLMLGMVYRF